MKKYWQFFTDIWRFFKNYHNPKTEDEWKIVIEKASELGKQYNGQMFKEIIIAVLNEIDRLEEYK